MNIPTLFVKGLLVSLLMFPALVIAESELASSDYVLPFKFKPTGTITLTIRLQKKVEAIYPDGHTQELLNKPERTAMNPHIVADFNFDGYKDIAINTSMDLRGLNSGYTLFLWDNKQQKLLETGEEIVNPSLELGFVIENDFSTICEYETPVCAYKKRYKWKNNKLSIHSDLIELNNLQTKIVFYRQGKKIESMAVLSCDIDLETERWDNLYID